MALAILADVEAWLGRSLTVKESSRGDALLARAEALVLGFLNCPTVPDPVPDAVRGTIAEMVGRLFESAGQSGVQQVSVDDGAMMFTSDASSGSPWLSKADKLALRPYRCGGGLSSVLMVSDRYEVTP